MCVWGGVCTAKLLRRNNKNSTTAERPQEEIERRDRRKLLDRKFYGPRRKLQRAEQLRFQAASRATSSPSSKQSNFESRQLAEQVRVQATSGATSSPDNGQSRFESRQRAEQFQGKEQTDPQKPGDANAGQSTACWLPRHHTAQSEYSLNPCPTCTLT